MHIEVKRPPFLSFYVCVPEIRFSLEAHLPLRAMHADQVLYTFTMANMLMFEQALTGMYLSSSTFSCPHKRHGGKRIRARGDGKAGEIPLNKLREGTRNTESSKQRSGHVSSRSLVDMLWLDFRIFMVFQKVSMNRSLHLLLELRFFSHGWLALNFGVMVIVLSYYNLFWFKKKGEKKFDFACQFGKTDCFLKL